MLCLSTSFNKAKDSIKAQPSDSHTAYRDENWHNLFRVQFGSMSQNYRFTHPLTQLLLGKICPPDACTEAHAI